MPPTHLVTPGSGVGAGLGAPAAICWPPAYGGTTAGRQHPKESP